MNVHQFTASLYCTGPNRVITSVYFLAIFIQVDNNKKDVNVTKWHCPCLVAHALIYAYKMKVVSSALPYTLPNK